MGVGIVILVVTIGMFTGAKSMAEHNYFAVKSQIEVIESEIKKSTWN